MQKCAARPHTVDDVTTRTIDAPFCSVPMTKFVKHESEKNPLEEAKMKEHFNELAKIVGEKKNEQEFGFPIVRIYLTKSLSTLTDIFDANETTYKAYDTLRW